MIEARSNGTLSTPTGGIEIEASTVLEGVGKALIIGREDFTDAEFWGDLAKKLYVHLPIWSIEVTTEKMKKWLRKFRVKEKEYLEATGYDTLEDFQRLNPTWPLRAWVGLLLEYVVERDEAKGVLRAYDRK